MIGADDSRSRFASQSRCFKWSRSLTEEFGRVSGYGGRVVTPIVDEDKVIVSMPNASWGELTMRVPVRVR